MPKNPRIPSYPLHKGSRQAVVLGGTSVYRGKWNSPQSRVEYKGVIAEWLANRQRPVGANNLYPAGPPTAPDAVTVNELILAYWRHAEGYYPADGETTSELRCICQALRPLRELYGHTPAIRFGPLALKAVRQKMLDKGWCRTHINHQTNRIRRVFRWGVAEELIPPSVFEALHTIAGLARGRGGVRES